MLPPERWQAEREELAVTFGRPLDPRTRLAELQHEQEDAVRALQRAIDSAAGCGSRGGKVIATRRTG